MDKSAMRDYLINSLKVRLLEERRSGDWVDSSLSVTNMYVRYPPFYITDFPRPISWSVFFGVPVLMAVALYFAIAPFMGHGGAFGIAFISWLIWMFFAEVTGSRIMTRYIWKYVLIAGLELVNEHPENERFKHFLDDEWVKESTKVVSSWWFLRQLNQDKWSPVDATSPWNYVRRTKIEDDTTAK